MFKLLHTDAISQTGFHRQVTKMLSFIDVALSRYSTRNWKYIQTEELSTIQYITGAEPTEHVLGRFVFETNT